MHDPVQWAASKMSNPAPHPPPPITQPTPQPTPHLTRQVLQPMVSWQSWADAQTMELTNSNVINDTTSAAHAKKCKILW